MKQYHRHDISIYDMQLFLTVAEELNFSRAADLVHLTQPTLGKRISAIEDSLGFSLFDRNKRPMELTAYGAVLYEEWSQLLEQFSAGIEKAKTAHASSACKLRIGLIDSSRPMSAVMRAARTLEAEHPNLKISWEYKPYNRWREQVERKLIDIMFILSMETQELDPIFESKEVVICPKRVYMLKTNPLAQRAHIGYEDLKGQRFIINSPKAMPSHYPFIAAHTRPYGYEPTVSKFTSSTHDLIGYLETDDEVVIGDEFLRDTDSSFLKAFDLPDTYSGLTAVWRRDNTNPFILSYVDMLCAFFASDGLK